MSAAERSWPRVVDGRTEWACCQSSIGPVCGHRAGTLHAHILSYQHGGIVSGGMRRADGTAWLGTYGTCRDCRQQIVQVSTGEALAYNRRTFIAVSDLDAAYAENADGGAR